VCHATERKKDPTNVTKGSLGSRAGEKASHLSSWIIPASIDESTNSNNKEVIDISSSKDDSIDNNDGSNNQQVD
jgi:hypothetical protein